MTAAAGAGIAALSLLATWAAPAPSRAAGAATIGLQAPLETHVARQLRRELTASGYRVVKLDPAADPDPPWVVTMDAGGGRVLLLVGLTGAGERQLLASFAVDVEDEVSIRRAALALVERLRREAAAPTAPRPSRSAPAPVATVPAPAAAPTPGATATLTTPRRPVSLASPPRRRPWSLGVATSVDVAGNEQQPLGHVQIVGESLLGERLLGQVRVLWPLLGRTSRLDERSVRAWTSGASVGLRLPLRPQHARLRPYLAAASGLRLVLSDTDWYDHRHGEVGLTPAVAGAFCGGMSLEIIPLVHMVLEAGGEWSHTLPGAAPRDHERRLASAPAARLALGISFQY